MSTAAADNTLTAIRSSRGEAKELAHLFLKRMKRSLSTITSLNWLVLMASVCLILLSLTIDGSSAAEIAAASSSAASSSSSSSAGSGTGSSAAAGAAATAASSGGANPLTGNWHQQQVGGSGRLDEAARILNELVGLEAQPSRSLEECAHWYQLNLRHRELVAGAGAGAGAAGPVLRQGAQLKEADCDQLEQLVAETRDRMDKFRHLLRGERGEFDYVGELASEYLELTYAASGNEQLAREFNDLRLGSATEGQLVGQMGKLEQLEQLMDFIRGSGLNLDDGEPFGLAQASASSALVHHQQPPPPPTGANHHLDELSELDSVLRMLIEREPVLTSLELGHMAELSGVLERRLNDGLVDLSSGRFRLLSGTLDAVRTILMHRAADEEDREEMAARRAYEAQQQVGVWDVRDRFEQVPRFHAPLTAASSAASQFSSSLSPPSVPSSAMAAASAASANTMMMPPNHSHRTLRNPMMETNGNVPYPTPDRSHLANIRMQQHQQQRRFAD